MNERFKPFNRMECSYSNAVITHNQHLKLVKKLTRRLQDLAQIMLNLNYKDVQFYQQDFDITYATLKAIRQKHG